MALVTTTVSDTISLADGTAPGAVLKFALNFTDTDGGVVVPPYVDVTLDAAGSFSIDLWPNSRGLRDTSYVVTMESVQDRRKLVTDLGYIQVPDTGTSSLYSILTVTLAQVPAVDFTAAQSAAAASESAAFAASVAAAGTTLAAIWPTTASGLGSGVAGATALVAGSGGADGTFALAFSGGTQVIAPEGIFTVSGGALVSVVITYSGYYSTGTPTLVFTASTGLTGASAVAQMAVNTDVAEYFAIPSPVAGEAMIFYRVDAGPVATEIVRTPSIDAINTITGEPSVVMVDPSDNMLAHVTPTEIVHPQMTTMSDNIRDNQLHSTIARQSVAHDDTARLVGQMCHLLFWGQSLAFGLGFALDNSSLQNNYTFMPNGGVDWQPKLGGDPTVLFATLEPMRRTGARAMIETVIQLLRDEDGVDFADLGIDLLGSAPGVTGETMASLSTTYYNRFETDLQYGNIRATALSETYQPACVIFAHGESDATSTTYLADLIAMQIKTQASAQTEAGSGRSLPYIINQTPSWVAGGATSPAVAIDQLAAHAQTDICCMGPIYHLSFADGFHPTGSDSGYGHFGALFGVALKRWFFDGVKPTPLSPSKAEAIGDSIVLTFPMDAGRKLVADTTTVAAQTNYGFTVVNASNVAQTISSAVLQGVDKVVLKMAATPAAGFKARYGWINDGSRGVGNIRDDSPLIWSPNKSNKPLQKWCCFFEETVV